MMATTTELLQALSLCKECLDEYLTLVEASA
jgi:hypothetical protein